MFWSAAKVFISFLVSYHRNPEVSFWRFMSALGVYVSKIEIPTILKYYFMGNI